VTSRRAPDASDRAVRDPRDGAMRDPRVESTIRTALVFGAALTCTGIAWTALAPSTMSNAAILMGFATCIWGLHRFGRTGADPAGRVADPDEPTDDP
jgi:hypothetical protein